MLKSSDRMMLVLTNGKVNVDCIKKKQKITIRRYWCWGKTFALVPFKKLNDDKIMYNEALQVVIEIQNKTEDQIKSKECSKKSQIAKGPTKSTTNAFWLFLDYNSTKNWWSWIRFRKLTKFKWIWFRK